jgi:hypothetical protein
MTPTPAHPDGDLPTAMPGRPVAILEASRGFQWDADPDESFEWMIGFIDRGLRSG